MSPSTKLFKEGPDMGYNFTEHWKKIKDPDIEIEVRGETFVLPPDLPVSFYLLQAQGDMTPQQIEHTTLVHLFGQENMDRWITEEKMGTTEYVALLQYITDIYRPKDPNAEGDNADDPKEVGTS